MRPVTFEASKALLLIMWRFVSSISALTLCFSINSKLGKEKDILPGHIKRPQ